MPQTNPESFLPNNLLTALIIDPNKREREALAQILNDHSPKIHVAGEAGNTMQALQLYKTIKPDIIFLDPAVSSNGGFQLLKQINLDGIELVIISPTDKFALQSIAFHPLAYLLKPLKVQDVVNTISGIVKKNTGSFRPLKAIDKSADIITVPTHEGSEFIPIRQILFFEANGNCTWIVQKNTRKTLSTLNLGEYEKMLPNDLIKSKYRFFRIHHKYLINMNYLRKYNRNESLIVLENKVQLNIAQRRKAAFFAFLKETQLAS